MGPGLWAGDLITCLDPVLQRGQAQRLPPGALGFQRRHLAEVGQQRSPPEIQALPPGHPTLQEPLQYLTALDGLLRSMIDPEELQRLREEAERELQDPGRWGLDFTPVQCWGQRRT
jgi:hypothetical protein